MCTLAAEQTSTWLMVDPWEAVQEYQRTAVVLDHFDYEISTKLGGVHTQDGEQRRVRVMLLAGSDLIATMSQPGVWSEADVRTPPPLCVSVSPDLMTASCACHSWRCRHQLDHILGRYGALIVERAGSDLDQAIDSLARWRHNIHLVHQLIQNDVSSTKVRLFLRRGLSVRYLLPSQVVDYIEQNGLYLGDGPDASAASGAVAAEKDRAKEKEKAQEAGPSTAKVQS
jgi:nicotinamide mononucleotide adenylyltransferase